MSYKARFRPCEQLGADGRWVEARSLIRRLTRQVDAAGAGRRLDEWGSGNGSASARAAVSRSEVTTLDHGRRGPDGRRSDSPTRYPGRRRAPARGRPTPGAKTRTFGLPTPSLQAADILFEDDWLVAVSKPAGIPTHETVDPRKASPRRPPDPVSRRSRAHELGGRDPTRHPSTPGPRHVRSDPLHQGPRGGSGSSRVNLRSRAVQKTYHALTAPRADVQAAGVERAELGSRLARASRRMRRPIPRARDPRPRTPRRSAPPYRAQAFRFASISPKAVYPFSVTSAMPADQRPASRFELMLHAFQLALCTPRPASPS
jgi:hypothetical protein